MSALSFTQFITKKKKKKNLYRQVSYTKHLPGGCFSGQERRDEHGAPVGDFAAMTLAAPGSSMCRDHPPSPAQPQGFCPTWTLETLTRIFQVLFAQLPCLTLLQPCPLKHDLEFICHLVLHPLNIFLYSHLPGSLYCCGASRFSPTTAERSRTILSDLDSELQFIHPSETVICYGGFSK